MPPFEDVKRERRSVKTVLNQKRLPRLAEIIRSREYAQRIPTGTVTSDANGKQQ